MSADDMAEFYVHTVTVETRLGAGSNGDRFAPPVTLSPGSTPPNGVFVDGARKLVRNKDGEQVVSETTLYTSPANAPLFTAGSRVTVTGDDSPSLVIKTNVNDSGDLDLPDHVAVSLT